MDENNSIKIFENKKIRTLWSEENEKWYFSIIDIISVLTDNDYQHARNYWKVLKSRLKDEGNQTVTNCNQLKLKAEDGKMRLTDVANTEQLFRKEFTDELKRSGINSQKDYAILTNILTETWSGYTVKEYKSLKGLKKENLRDNMSNMELVLNMLAETSSTEISKGVNPKGFEETQNVVIQGGRIAKDAKE